MKRFTEKYCLSQFFAILTLQTLFSENIAAFFLETSIPENMGDLKRIILTLQ